MRSVKLPLIAIAASLLSCAGDYALSPNRVCDNSTQCPVGQVCMSFRCEFPPTLNGTVHVEITPPDRLPQVTTQLLNFPADSLVRNPPSLELDPLVELRVRLFDEGGTEIDGSISIVGANRIPGRERMLSREIFREDEVSQRIQLPEGMYRATIKRDGRPGFRADLEVTTPRDLNIMFERSRRLFGVVSTSLGPIAGATVRANGTLSGLLSTSSTTSVDGRYAIELPETDEPLRLVVEVAQPAWGYEEVIQPAPGMDDVEKLITVIATPPSLPERVRIRLLDSVGAPVPAGVITTFTATRATDIDTRTFSTTGETDADGYVKVLGASGLEDLAFLPAAYEMSVSPQADSIVARSTMIVDLSSGTADREIRMPERANISVNVLSAFGRPVRGAALELRDLNALSITARASVSGAGRAQALIDPGPYFLIAKPREAGLPVGFGEITVNDGGETQFSMTLRQGVGARGRVTRDGLPLENAKVELFQPRLGRAISLGTATTNNNGSFEIVIPAEDNL